MIFFIDFFQPCFLKENLFIFSIPSVWFFSVLCQWYRRRCLFVASWTRKQFHQANYGMFQTLPANIDMCTHIYLILVLPQIIFSNSYFMTGYQISHVYKYWCLSMLFSNKKQLWVWFVKAWIVFSDWSLTESAMSQQDHQWLQLHWIVQPHRYSGTLLREQECLSVGHATTPKECLCAL